MGLEYGDQAPGLERARGPQGRCDLGRMVGVVVIHERPPRGPAEPLEAPLGAIKAGEGDDRRRSVGAARRAASSAATAFSALCAPGATTCTSFPRHWKRDPSGPRVASGMS